MPVEAHETDLLECPVDDSAPHETRCQCGCQTQPVSTVEKDVSKLFEYMLALIFIAILASILARC